MSGDGSNDGSNDGSSDGSNDRSVFARAITKEKRKRGKSLPSVDLEAAITKIKIKDMMSGSSTIVVSILDPGWRLLDSGFFDARRDGRLDAIDVNYPDESRFWWRVTQIAVTSASGGALLDLTFMERASVHMMHHHGPVKVSRAKRTRAQFLKMLSSRVKAGGGIKFHSKELKVAQPQADEDPKAVKSREKTERQTREDKDAGISSSERITFRNWDGAEVTLKPGELANAERVLQEAVEHTNSDRPTLALLCACIVEAPFFRNPLGGDSSSVGILQLLDIHGSVSKRRDIAWVTKEFLVAGFTGAGGAVALAKKNPGWSPGQIAQAVQGSAFPDRYQKVLGGARQVLDAFGGAGGAGGGGGTYRKQYNFEIGTDENPREDYWSGSNRLAEEVKWAYFLDGQDLYFDSEMTLIKQKAAAIVRRGDPAITGFDCNWDARDIATEATLRLVCDPFEFRAGEVFVLRGFGPASTGSTADLPGRWLVESADRDPFEPVTTFALKQPEDPAPEPRSDVAQRKEDEGAAGVASGADLVHADRADDIADALVKIAKEVGGSGVFVVSGYRPGDPLDHGGDNKDRAARDIAVRGIDALVGPPSPKLDKAIVAIGHALGKNYGSGKSGPFQNADNITYKGFRVQLIWRTSAWGGHLGHIHVGVKRIGGPYTPGGSTGPQGLPG